MEKLFPMEAIFEQLKSVSLCQNERFVSKIRNHWQECLKIRKKKKNGFHWPETPFPLTGMRDLFKNTFPQDGKVKLAGARMSENGEKIVSTS